MLTSSHNNTLQEIGWNKNIKPISNCNEVKIYITNGKDNSD